VGENGNHYDFSKNSLIINEYYSKFPEVTPLIILELVAVLLIGIFIGANFKLRAKKQRRVPFSKTPTEKLPFDLGIKKGTSYSNSLNQLYLQLENSLEPTYLEHVKSRVITKNLWSEKNFALYLYGLKQYFLLCAVLKTVPMFSKEMDDIWHEMLIFTREYQEFCNQFIGEMIHHAPTVSKMESCQRAEFDWLYTQFFEVNEITKYIYTGFFRFKLDKNKIREFEGMTVQEIQSYFFKDNKMSESLAWEVSNNLLKQVEQAKRHKGNTITDSNDDHFMILGLFVDDQIDHKHHDTNPSGHQHSSQHHSDSSSHHSCSSHSCSSHSCSSCSSCSS
jgi:hypothetical protein